MKKLILILVATLSGCSFLGSINNYENSSISQVYMSKIAADSSKIIAAHAPPGKTQIAVISKGIFGKMLIEELHKNGFAVAENKDNGIQLNYLLDELDSTSYRLALIMPNWRIDITYQADNEDILRKNQTQRVENDE